MTVRLGLAVIAVAGLLVTGLSGEVRDPRDGHATPPVGVADRATVDASFLAARSVDVGQGDAKPTGQMYLVFEDLCARSDDQLGLLDRVLKTEVTAAVNRTDANSEVRR